jgi:hypothetical protein
MVTHGHVCKLFHKEFMQEKKKLCYFKMIGTIDVNLLRTWGERIDVWEG